MPEHVCGTCGDDILGKWIRMRMTQPRIEVAWQLASRTCVDCHRRRHTAAHEYDLACGEVRLWMMLGAQPSGPGRAPPGHRELAAAIHRVQDADARCVELGLWPAERKFRRPPWFYGDERSNTE